MIDPQYQGCWEDLQASDANTDGFLQSNEYSAFVHAYHQRLFGDDCADLGVAEQMNFNLLACESCLYDETDNDQCCVGDMARIPLSQLGGSLFVQGVCDLTAAAMEPCPIEAIQEPNSNDKATGMSSFSSDEPSSSSISMGTPLILGLAWVVAILTVLLLAMSFFIYRRRIQDCPQLHQDQRTVADSKTAEESSCKEVVVIEPLDSEEDDSEPFQAA